MCATSDVCRGYSLQFDQLIRTKHLASRFDNFDLSHHYVSCANEAGKDSIWKDRTFQGHVQAIMYQCNSLRVTVRALATESKKRAPTGVSRSTYWRPVTRGRLSAVCFLACSILSDMLNRTTPTTCRAARIPRRWCLKKKTPFIRSSLKVSSLLDSASSERMVSIVSSLYCWATHPFTSLLIETRSKAGKDSAN